MRSLKLISFFLLLLLTRLYAHPLPHPRHKKKTTFNLSSANSMLVKLETMCNSPTTSRTVLCLKMISTTTRKYPILTMQCPHQSKSFRPRSTTTIIPLMKKHGAPFKILFATRREQPRFDRPIEVTRVPFTKERVITTRCLLTHRSLQSSSDPLRVPLQQRSTSTILTSWSTVTSEATHTEMISTQKPLNSMESAPEMINMNMSPNTRNDRTFIFYLLPSEPPCSPNSWSEMSMTQKTPLLASDSHRVTRSYRSHPTSLIFPHANKHIRTRSTLVFFNSEPECQESPDSPDGTSPATLPCVATSTAIQLTTEPTWPKMSTRNEEEIDSSNTATWNSLDLSSENTRPTANKIFQAPLNYFPTRKPRKPMFSKRVHITTDLQTSTKGDIHLSKNTTAIYEPNTALMTPQPSTTLKCEQRSTAPTTQPSNKCSTTEPLSISTSRASTTTTNQVTTNQVTTNQVTTNQVTTNQVTTNQVTTNQVTTILTTVRHSTTLSKTYHSSTTMYISSSRMSTKVSHHKNSTETTYTSFETTTERSQHEIVHNIYIYIPLNVVSANATLEPSLTTNSTQFISQLSVSNVISPSYYVLSKKPPTRRPTSKRTEHPKITKTLLSSKSQDHRTTIEHNSPTWRELTSDVVFKLTPLDLIIKGISRRSTVPIYEKETFSSLPRTSPYPSKLRSSTSSRFWRMSQRLAKKAHVASQAKSIPSPQSKLFSMSSSSCSTVSMKKLPTTSTLPKSNLSLQSHKFYTSLEPTSKTHTASLRTIESIQKTHMASSPKILSSRRWTLINRRKTGQPRTIERQHTSTSAEWEELYS